MYNKIFTKILDSSIWLEPTPTRIVWITFLAAMDETGFCSFAAAGNVAGRARVSLKDAKTAIQILENPDPDSSDPDHEGRRIERVPGGWMVLNAAKYRQTATRAGSQEKTRERVRRFREKKRAGIGETRFGNGAVTLGNAGVTPSEAYTEAKTKTLALSRGDFTPPLEVLPLNDGEFALTEKMLADFTPLYPAVDVRQAFREMKGWCIANPMKRKTRKGVLRFVNSWLAREQDRGSHVAAKHAPLAGMTFKNGGTR